MKKEFNKKYNEKDKTGSKAGSGDKPRKASFSKEFKNKEERVFRPRKSDETGEKSSEKKFPERKTRDAAFGNDRKRNDKESPDRKTTKYSEGKKPFGERKFDKKPFDSRRASDKKFGDSDKPLERSERTYGEKKERRFEPDKERRSFDKPRKEGSGTRKPFVKRERDEKDTDTFKNKKTERRDFDGTKKEFSADKKSFRKPISKKITVDEDVEEEAPPKARTTGKSIDEPMTLNKYIAHSGECSRRDAAEFVKQGKVRVNGELILEPGYRVAPGDTVTLSGKKMTPQKDLVYVLLNKPKDFITTTEDPQERKTVMDLVANSGVDRLYPVGRLDRNTTGLLLLTNDGALAHKLSHPSYNIRKVYHVTLDKNLTKADYEKIYKGVELEDGKANVDEIAYLENRHELGLEIHNGRNRIVRRIFESLGYVVEKLDRVMYAGLTKKNLPRGKWRFLDEKEIIFLKHFK